MRRAPETALKTAFATDCRPFSPAAFRLPLRDHARDRQGRERLQDQRSRLPPAVVFLGAPSDDRLLTLARHNSFRKGTFAAEVNACWLTSVGSAVDAFRRPVVAVAGPDKVHPDAFFSPTSITTADAMPRKPSFSLRLVQETIAASGHVHGQLHLRQRTAGQHYKHTGCHRDDFRKVMYPTRIDRACWQREHSRADITGHRTHRYCAASG